MPGRAVINAGPLVALSLVGRLDLSDAVVAAACRAVELG
jgi:hypothetical protein